MMLTLVDVEGPQKDSVSPLALWSAVKSLGCTFFVGGNEWLQLSCYARGRSLWSVNERPVESVGGQENR